MRRSMPALAVLLLAAAPAFAAFDKAEIQCPHRHWCVRGPATCPAGSTPWGRGLR